MCEKMKEEERPRDEHRGNPSQGWKIAERDIDDSPSKIAERDVDDNPS